MMKNEKSLKKEEEKILCEGDSSEGIDFFWSNFSTIFDF